MTLLTGIQEEVRDYHNEALKMDTHETSEQCEQSDPFRKRRWTGRAAGCRNTGNGEIKVKVKRPDPFTAAILRIKHESAFS
jgi:hypothetical protein